MSFIVALFAIVLGLIVCFSGYRFFKLLLPVWGFFAGLWLGGAAMSALFGQGFLSSVTGIIVGLILGVVFAVLSYLFWYVAFAIAGGFIGYWLLALIWQAIGLQPGVIMTILGVLVGIIFALAFIFLNAQKSFLIIVTALGGAGLAINGILMLFGGLKLDQLQHSAFVPNLHNSIIWTVVWLVVAAAGMASQFRVSRNYTLEVSEW